MSPTEIVSKRSDCRSCKTKVKSAGAACTTGVYTPALLSTLFIFSVLSLIASIQILSWLSLSTFSRQEEEQSSFLPPFVKNWVTGTSSSTIMTASAATSLLNGDGRGFVSDVRGSSSPPSLSSASSATPTKASTVTTDKQSLKRKQTQSTPKSGRGPAISDSPKTKPGNSVPIHLQTMKEIAPNYRISNEKNEGAGADRDSIEGIIWDDERVHQEFEQALGKIRSARIRHVPFDHIAVPDLFSSEFYQALMSELPPISQYTSASYPGTEPIYQSYFLANPTQLNRTLTGEGAASAVGARKRKVVIPDDCFSRRVHVHGVETVDEKRQKAGCWKESVQYHNETLTRGLILTVNDETTAPKENSRGAASSEQQQGRHKFPLWMQAFRLVHSRNFTHLLYHKFATDTGIPRWKQALVQVVNYDDKENRRDAAAVAAAAKDEGRSLDKERHNQRYNITELRNTAALRIEPKGYHLSPHVDRYEKLVTWQFFHPETDELKNKKVGTFFYRPKPEYEGMFEIHTEDNPNWMDYKFFERVLEQPVVPNYFFAFAPNNQSWHGASIQPHQLVQEDGVTNSYARRTFLGFITTQKWNWHHFHANDWAPTEYDFVSPT